ncbi:MAG: diguanylate cyclase, partial [Sphingomonas parapaucimobilis]
MTPGTVSARAVDLYPTVCSAALPDSATDAGIVEASYRCGAQAPTRGADWLWLRLDTSRLGSLPPGWDLLIDQTRFDRIALMVVTRDDIVRRSRSYADLRDHWTPGGLLKFVVPTPGRDVRGLYIGFRRIDDLSLMRKVVARPGSVMNGADVGWLVLSGLFAGTLLSAFLYNLVIHAGRRPAFQRWYLLWVAVALVYGVIWTNTAALVVPWLVGPIAVRISFVLVGLMVAAGNM